MTWLYLHLILNHIPIVGYFFALLVMIAALLWSKREAFFVGAWLSAISCLGAIFSYITGEEAKEFIEGFGVPELAKTALAAHEQAAALALICTMVGASAAGAALLIFQKQPLRPLHQIGWLVVLLNLPALFSTAYTGYVGARIAHQELHSTSEGLLELEDDKGTHD